MERFGFKQFGLKPFGFKQFGFKQFELKPFGFKLNWPFSKKAEIQFVEFVDFDRDVIGLGTRGHYGNIAILAALSQHQASVYLSRVQVRQVWAKFENHEFAEVSRWTIGAEPMTLVEFI